MSRMNALFEQAWMNLRSQKLRSFLAVLGILVGTAAVVALISSGQLATQKALEEFQELGTDLLAINVYQNNNTPKYKTPIPLSYWRQLPMLVPGLTAIAPYQTVYQSLSFNGHPVTGAIIGADESLADIIHIDLEVGHFVSFVDTYERFCVLGHSLAATLSPHPPSLIDQHLMLGHTPYRIIGIAAPWRENGFFNEDINKAVIVPLQGLALLSKDVKINNAVVRLEEDMDIHQTLSILEDTLKKQAPEHSIFIRSAKQIIKSMESQGQIFTLLLGTIGGISLLVGGIGVMNVMLVSVSERKKEIGLRKAIGANPKQIQHLFLAESILLSLFGGVCGVMIGIVMTYLISLFSQWSFHFHLLPILAGFSVSVATGIFFGFYPARRASKLNAVVCLRSD